MTEKRPGRYRVDTRFMQDRLAPEIRQLLRKLDIPQREVADFVGVSQASVSNAAGGKASLEMGETVLAGLEALRAVKTGQDILFTPGESTWPLPE